jgi:hypothetical protein
LLGGNIELEHHQLQNIYRRALIATIANCTNKPHQYSIFTSINSASLTEQQNTLRNHANKEEQEKAITEANKSIQ